MPEFERGAVWGKTAAKAVLFPEMGLVYEEKDTVQQKCTALRIRKDSSESELKTSWHLGTNYSLQNQMRIHSEKE